MSLAFKCDRCGQFKELPSRDDIGSTTTAIFLHRHDLLQHVYLCESCGAAFFNFMSDKHEDWKWQPDFQLTRNR
jgi:DNA-directed RNA polymerase subunit RPC12/RpoP